MWTDRSASPRQIAHATQQRRYTRTAAQTLRSSAGPCSTHHCFTTAARGRYPFVLLLRCCGCQPFSAAMSSPGTCDANQQLADSKTLCSVPFQNILAAHTSSQASCSHYPKHNTSQPFQIFCAETQQLAACSVMSWLHAACCLPKWTYYRHPCQNRLSANMPLHT